MVANKYVNKTGLISTDISGGRTHHSYRNGVGIFNTYEYELKYGENFHTLSATIFGSDEYYWVLADNNKPINVFDMPVSLIVTLPSGITKTDSDKRIF